MTIFFITADFLNNSQFFEKKKKKQVKLHKYTVPILFLFLDEHNTFGAKGPLVKLKVFVALIKTRWSTIIAVYLRQCWIVRMHVSQLPADFRRASC